MSLIEHKVEKKITSVKAIEVLKGLAVFYDPRWFDDDENENGLGLEPETYREYMQDTREKFEAIQAGVRALEVTNALLHAIEEGQHDHGTPCEHNPPC